MNALSGLSFLPVAPWPVLFLLTAHLSLRTRDV